MTGFYMGNEYESINWTELIEKHVSHATVTYTQIEPINARSHTQMYKTKNANTVWVPASWPQNGGYKSASNIPKHQTSKCITENYAASFCPNLELRDHNIKIM